MIRGVLVCQARRQMPGAPGPTSDTAVTLKTKRREVPGSNPGCVC